MINAKVKGLNKLLETVRRKDAQSRKAADVAVRTAGFKRMRELQKGLRRGSVEGAPLSGLTYISRAMRARGTGKNLGPNKPLARTAVAIRYHIIEPSPIKMAVGWTGPMISKSWKRIARFQQEGGTKSIPSAFRKSLIKLASAYSKRSIVRKFLFINKSKTHFTTPARPVIAPWWLAVKDRTKTEIIENFRRKMRGERI
jgi:hypothetical protein